MTKEQFRSEFGAQWNAVVSSPMWAAAMALAEEDLRVFKINTLTDAEIQQFGALKLKEMQGHTRLESALSTLAVKPFEFVQLEQTHPDPIAEADAEAKRLEALSHPQKSRKKKSP